MRAAASRAWIALVCLLMCGLALSSCEGVDGPETQVMLRIQSEDRQLLSTMTSLRVGFSLEEDMPWGWQSHPVREFPLGVLHWPVDIPIVPSEPDDERKRFEVVIEALDGSRVLAQQRAVTGFVAGGLRLLEVWLYTCPSAGEALQCLEPGCQYDGCGVCQLDGVCGSSAIARERLPAFDVDQDPISRPPFGASGGLGGALGQLDGGVGMGAQSMTGANAAIANPSGGSLSGTPGMPGGAGSSDADTMPPSTTPDAGAGASAGGGSGDSGSTDSGGGAGAGGSIGATVPDAGLRDAGVGTVGGTTGATTGGSAAGGIFAGGGVDAGMRDAGPQDAGIDSSFPEGGFVSGAPEGGFIGGTGGGTAEAGSVGGNLGGLAGGPGATSAFSFDESEFGPGSYSGE